ncbi:MAG: DnaA regulatory inactivator Hda [Gammaproteobacteria bacterium]|nr:DnaA regulatory inactivator Hda [Gammaproteobacteria bacterium]MCH9763081.1 DnaA regulatory inactivator Hda [Gammaproteobacteria bacterium]
MNHQLALAIQLNDEATFDDYCWGENTQLKKELYAALSNTGERFIYLWGAAGCGKSHLLQACCQHISPNEPSIYLPLNTLKTWDPTILSDLETHRLFCIDELDAIVGLHAWEEALFHLYNRIRDDAQSTLIIACLAPPRQAHIVLPDLQSRLSSGLVMHIQDLSDADKVHSLSLEANRRGFELSPSVAQFLVNRSARSMHDLHTLLDRLDHASLVAQRKITIPFIKTTLSW